MHRVEKTCLGRDEEEPSRQYDKPERGNRTLYHGLANLGKLMRWAVGGPAGRDGFRGIA